MNTQQNSGPAARLSVRAFAMKLFLRLSGRKRIYTSVEGLMEGIAETRRTGPAKPPIVMQKTVQISAELVDGCVVYVLKPRSSRTEPQVILYLHGGAYCRPITSHHWSFLEWLVLDQACTVVVPLYPLAPENTCLDAVRIVRQVHAWAVKRYGGIDTFSGDSAGAGLALAFCQDLQATGSSLPQRLVLITPFVDAELTAPEIKAIEARDVMLGIDGLREAARLYAGGLAVEHPYVSPLQANLHGFPAMQIFAGTDDLLSHDAIRFAEKAREAGCSVDLQIGPGMMHVWPILPLPEAQRSQRAISQFLKNPSYESLPG